MDKLLLAAKLRATCSVALWELITSEMIPYEGAPEHLPGWELVWGWLGSLPGQKLPQCSRLLEWGWGMNWRMRMTKMDNDTSVPSLQLFLATYRLLKSSVMANLHVTLAVVVSNRRQNVTPVQLFRPALMLRYCVKRLQACHKYFTTWKMLTTLGDRRELPPARNQLKCSMSHFLASIKNVLSNTHPRLLSVHTREVSPVSPTVWGRRQFARPGTGWSAWKIFVKVDFIFVSAWNSTCLSDPLLNYSHWLLLPSPGSPSMDYLHDAYDFVGNAFKWNLNRLPFQPKVIDHGQRWSGIDPPPSSPWAGLSKSLRFPLPHLAHCLSHKGAATPEENTK